MTGRQTVSGAENGYTVFRGLEDAGVPGRKLAAALGVTPSTYSKWRSGHMRIPASRLVLLTLVLAERLETLETAPRRTDPRFMAHLKTLRRSLDYQESLNRKLAPEDVQEGSRLFRRWWMNNNADQVSVASNKDMAVWELSL